MFCELSIGKVGETVEIEFNSDEFIVGEERGMWDIVDWIRFCFGSIDLSKLLTSPLNTFANAICELRCLKRLLKLSNLLKFRE